MKIEANSPPLLPHDEAQKGFCIAWCTVLTPQLSQVISGIKHTFLCPEAAQQPLLLWLCSSHLHSLLISAVTRVRRLIPFVALKLEISATTGLFSLSPPASHPRLGHLQLCPCFLQPFLQSCKTYKYPDAARSLLNSLRNPSL